MPPVSQNVYIIHIMYNDIKKKKNCACLDIIGYKSLRDRSASPRHCETERPETETRPRPKTVEAVTRPRPRKSGLETETGLEKLQV